MEIKRKLATIEKVLDVQPIEGADSIVKVKIRDWWCVARKDEFEVDDVAVYFEIDSLLPSSNPVFAFLGNGSKEKTIDIDGIEFKGYRLKTVKLRGQVSQGLVLPINQFKELTDESFSFGEDVTDILGIVKYEAPIPACLSGIAKGSFPNFIPKTDEERIQNCSDVLEKYKDVPFYATEKIDGTSTTYYKKDGIFGVCSRNLELIESDVLQWRKAKELAIDNNLPDGYAIQGELFGEGIQGNPLKIKGQRIYFFSVFDISKQEFLSFKEFVSFIENIKLETVPVYYSNYYLNNDTVESLLDLSDKFKSYINKEVNAEGLVFRSEKEMKAEINGSLSRLSFKVLSNKYLLKKEK